MEWGEIKLKARLRHEKATINKVVIGTKQLGIPANNEGSGWSIMMTSFMLTCTQSYSRFSQTKWNNFIMKESFFSAGKAFLNKIMDLFHNEIISFCQWKATIKLASVWRGKLVIIMLWLQLSWRFIVHERAAHKRILMALYHHHVGRFGRKKWVTFEKNPAEPLIFLRLLDFIAKQFKINIFTIKILPFCVNNNSGQTLVR
jgi:hypothetical protein